MPLMRAGLLARDRIERDRQPGGGDSEGAGRISPTLSRLQISGRTLYSI